MSAADSAFSTDDTIVAIATPPGRGAIGIARLSGAEARQIAERRVWLAGQRLAEELKQAF